jgi:ubiquinone biosynthesis protein Coq4
MSQAPSPPSATSTPSTHVDVIILRHPSSYGGEVSKSELNKENVDPGEEHTIFEAPTVEWMEKTWAVTHSTLHMWRSCKNVKITYQALGDGKMSDLVENTVVQRVR